MNNDPEKILNVVKLASISTLLIGFIQTAFYTFWYSVPFPFSLSNLAVILSMLAIAAMILVILTILYLSGNLLASSSLSGYLNFLVKDEDTRLILMTVVALVILMFMLLPVTTGYIFQKIGLGGGLRVVYWFNEMEQNDVSKDLLEKCGESGCISKPLYLVIDSGDYVYVRPDWNNRDVFYGIKKSEITFVKNVP